MNDAFSIDSAVTQALLLGNPADIHHVRSRLDTLIQGPVMDYLAQALQKRLPGQSLVRAPELHVRLRLTRAELDSSKAAERWADAILLSLDNALNDARATTYTSTAAFHAAYVRHRLGLEPMPGKLLTEFSILDHLPALHAVGQMLAVSPQLWMALARDNKQAMEIVRAVLAKGGTVGAHVLFQAIASKSGTQSNEPIDIKVIVQALLAQLPALSLPDTSVWQSLSAESAILLAALLGAQELEVSPLRKGRLLALLLQEPALFSVAPETLVETLRQRMQSHDEHVVAMQVILSALVDQPELAQQLRSLVSRVVSSATESQSSGNARQPEIGLKPDATDAVQATRQTAVEIPERGLRHFTAPFAGIALLLPHLLEDEIGAAFSAVDRLQALAGLIRSTLFPAPQESELLRALCGTDTRDANSDRPNERDLFFVPRDRWESVMNADPGASRLACWLSARFAGGLPGLQASSSGFLQRQFWHVPGEAWISKQSVTVRMDPMPLLPVLQLSGRLNVDTSQRVTWLQNQKLVLRVQSRSVT